VTGGAGVLWSPDRSRHQGRVVAGLYGAAAAVPAERRAVLAGGLRGADKDTALDKAGLDRARYLLISVDAVLAELARRSLIPVVAGLAPLEGADLVHAEARHVAKRLAALALAQGTNVLLDVTAASWGSVRSWLHVADRAAFTLDVVIADISAAEAVRWADADHARGQAAYRRGRGDGARPAAPEAIAAAAPLAAVTAQRPWGRHISHLNRHRAPAFPAGEVFSLVAAYAGGRLSLDGLAARLRARAWPPVPSAIPPGAPEAGPAIDDLEPWQPGSFDEVILARDLGLLPEADYTVLAAALGGGG
jgi:hypothetical protein